MDDKLGHLAATYSQLEERIAKLTRELAESREEAERWKRLMLMLEDKLFRKMHEVCAEQREMCAQAIEEKYKGGTLAAEWLRRSPLLIEPEDFETRFDLSDVPPEAGGLT